jgi:16S rRNA (guanine527-N7)-methyltransferase
MTNEDKLFDIYLNELIEWNKKFNLTSVDDPSEIKVRHFEDSLSVLKAIELKDEAVLDIGPGAGFPGIPLKIVRPGIKLTMIEATRKKVEFLEHIIRELKLDNTRVIWGRAEVLGKEAKFKGRYDVVVGRAVAKLPLFVGYGMPFLKMGGILAAMKQENVEDEIDCSREVMRKNGSKLKGVIKVKVGDLTRSIVLIEKT